MTHDPLCLADPATDNSRCHYCVLIAKVREDTNASQLTMWNRTQEQAAFIIETATKSVWIDGYGEGRKDMLAKCITALEVEMEGETQDRVDGLWDAIVALRALQEKP
jgi:hypothetical protein